MQEDMKAKTIIISQKINERCDLEGASKLQEEQNIDIVFITYLNKFLKDVEENKFGTSE